MSRVQSAKRGGYWVGALLLVVVVMFAFATPASGTESSGRAFKPIAKGDLILSVDNVNGDPADGRVEEFTPNGALVQTLVSHSSEPTGSVFDAEGNLYVTEFGANDILRVDAVTGAVTTFSDNAILDDGTVYNSPESIAFGPDGKMYVSDANRDGPGGGIHIVDPLTGKGLGFLPLPSSTGSMGKGESDWLAFNAAGDLYMTNENDAQGVMRVNLATGDVVQPSFIPNTPGAYAISYDPHGNIWLASTAQISEYSPAGVPIRSILNENNGTLFAATFNPSGNVFFVTANNGPFVGAYDLNGNLLGSFNVPDANGGFLFTGVGGVSVAGGFLPAQHATLQVAPATGDFHDPTTVSGVLHDSTGQVVANEPISFVLNHAESCTGITDTAGTASCSLIPNEPAGTYPLDATFAGDSAKHLVAASATTTFAVTAEQTALSYTGPTAAISGHAIALSARLGTDDPTAGSPIVAKTVEFTVGTGATTQTCSATTDANGAASCTVTLNQSAGPVPVSATFAGDTAYLAATAPGTISVSGSDPVISAIGTSITATEGQSFSGQVAAFTDPDRSATPNEYGARIDWGDGTTSSGVVSGSGGTFTVTGTHTSAEEGTPVVATRITDATNAANTATARSAAAVADANLSAACVAPSMSANAFYGPVATFTDADPDGAVGDYAARIDWGDGTSSAGTIVGPASGRFTVDGTHVYPSTGPSTKHTVNVSVKDAGGASATTGSGCPLTAGSAVGLTNQTPIAFTADSATAAATVGIPYSYTFAASRTPAATFTVASGALPPGLTLDPSSGRMSGTPKMPGAYSFTIRASNGMPADALSPQQTIMVALASVPPTFTADAPPPTSTQLAPYVGYFFEATGTPAPTISLASGALPDGFTLTPTGNPGEADLEGTPTRTGVFTFTLRASNGVAPAALTPPLTVVVRPAVDFTAESPPRNATMGVAYAYTYAVLSTTPPPRFTVSVGALPNGLFLNATTGKLSGTPTVAGTFIFTVTASNSAASVDASQTTITVSAAAASSITADAPPPVWSVGGAYSYLFAATGSPAPAFAVASGALPDGLTLDASGYLLGTPTTPGIFSFTVRASNGVIPDALSPTLTITVTPAGVAPTFTAATPPNNAQFGVPYSYTFAATGTPAPTFLDTYGALPDGLTLDPVTGVLSGTPKVAATFVFTVRAANGTAPDAFSAPITLTVTPRQAPTFTAESPPPTAAVGLAYSYTFAAIGPPVPTFAVASGALPNGLTLNQTTGVLSGTPTALGVFSFTVSARNGVPPAATTPTLTITVTQTSAPKFTNDTPSDATVETAYSYAFTANGAPAPVYTVASGALPSGLTLDPVTGVVAGTPTTSGTFPFRVRAANGVPPDAVTPTVTITVLPTTLTANDLGYSVQTGRELDVPAPGILGFNTPLDPSLPLTAHLENDNALGTVVLQPDGAFSYVPPRGFTGGDSFTYTLRDSAGDTSNVATVGINVTAGGPPTASVSTISPAADTTITGPVPITATLTPPAGQTMTAWTISYRRPGDPALTPLATGTGTSVNATFDPTLVRDGTYQIDIHAVASGGGILQTESGLIVDGIYKPGRYATTFQDMTFNAVGLPINVQRTYDNTNKTNGDFGFGWTLGLADFRVDTNGALGNGGWSPHTCGALGGSVCYTSNAPHIVTVTWPDGHIERFDMTPAPASAFFFPNATTSAFTAEPGSTSTLQAVDNNILFTNGGRFYEGTILTGPTALYDPLQFTLTAKNGTQYTLDRHAGLTSETNPNGNNLTINSAGIQASSGPSVAFNRDANNRISQIVGTTGTINYTYSTAGDLAAVQYPNGATQAFTYDTQHNLFTTRGGGKLVRTLHYDTAGRIDAVTDGNGHTTTISTNVAGHQQVFTDTTGQLTTINTDDNRGDLIQQDRTFGTKTITTKATYDTLGRQRSSTDGNGHTTSQTLNAAGETLTQTDANGHTTTYTYNAFGEPLTITDPLGKTTTNTYDTSGNLLTTKDPNGATTTNTYYIDGLLWTTTDPTGRMTSRLYDGTGQLSSITDPGGNVTAQTVDDTTGRVTSITDPTGATTTFRYDADGNVTAITDARGHTRHATYDAFDRVISLTDANGKKLIRTYDNAGNLTSILDRNGATSIYGFDADSRLISKTIPGAGTTTYTYDPAGRLIGATNTTAQLVFTYDDADHVLTATTTGTLTSLLPTTTFTYTYDPAGNVRSVQGPSGTTQYSYDPNERLAQVIDPSNGNFTYTRDPAGQVTSMTRPNGITDTTTYDPAGRIATLHSTLGTTLVNKADYTFDGTGLRNSLTTTAGRTNYGYDAASQLTTATFPASTGLPTEHYTYDPVGNRTSTASSPLGSFTYDSADRLLSDATNTYTYDNEGNLTSTKNKATGATTNYAWTAEHQLTGITYPDSSTSAFKYDPVGRRVQVTDNTTTTRYAFDGVAIAAEYDAANTLLATYMHDPRDFTRPLEMVRAGQRYFYLADAENSTTALATVNGNVADRYGYDAFGKPTGPHALPNPFSFTGQYYDQRAGLVLFPLRAFDPTSGRFLSEDPRSALNPYPYATNDPTNVVDPSGAGTVEDTILRLKAPFQATVASATRVGGVAAWVICANRMFDEFGFKFFAHSTGYSIPGELAAALSDAFDEICQHLHPT